MIYANKVNCWYFKTKSRGDCLKEMNLKLDIIEIKNVCFGGQNKISNGVCITEADGGMRISLSAIIGSVNGFGTSNMSSYVR